MSHSARTRRSGRARRAPGAALAIAAAMALAIGLPAGAARAQEAPVDPYGDPPPDAPPPPSDPGDSIDDQVAQALYQRGLALMEKGETAYARRLFIESLQRSPRGAASADARRMLREANRKLGAPPDDGLPSAGGEGGVLDPYGAGSAGEQPLDPYAGGGAGQGDGGAVDQPGEEPGSRMGRRAVIAWSAALGLVTGLAIAGPESDGDTIEPGGVPERVVSGGALLVGALGAAGGAGLSWWLTGRRPLEAGEAAAVVSAINWGAVNIGFFGDAVTGTDSDPNDVWKFVAAGGLLGAGGGALWAVRSSPSQGDVAFINSLGLYGAAGGLLAGVGIQPPHNEAYSINALVGSTLGLTTGFLLRDHVEMSRRRTLWMDLGAAAGAVAPWLLIYPLVNDDGTEDDEQVIGWLSVFTLGGGALAGWYLTRDMDAPPEGEEAAEPAPPAVARRDGDGRWRLGAPLPRPMALPRLGPAEGRSFGIDLVSGRF